MKLKLWIGNYDGERTGLVIATSQVKASKVVHCGVKTFTDYWSVQDGTKVEALIARLKPETLYTQDNRAWGSDEWFEGRCPRPPRRA